MAAGFTTEKWKLGVLIQRPGSLPLRTTTAHKWIDDQSCRQRDAVIYVLTFLQTAAGGRHSPDLGSEDVKTRLHCCRNGPSKTPRCHPLRGADTFHLIYLSTCLTIPPVPSLLSTRCFLQALGGVLCWKRTRQKANSSA